MSFTDNDREFYVNILAINSGGDDNILCLDWQNTFHAIIDCRRKNIVFSTPIICIYWWKLGLRASRIQDIFERGVLKARELGESMIYVVLGIFRYAS